MQGCGDREPPSSGSRATISTKPPAPWDTTAIQTRHNIVCTPPVYSQAKWNKSKLLTRAVAIEDRPKLHNVTWNLGNESSDVAEGLG